MKLIIRDEKDDTCEIWLEVDEYRILVRSRLVDSHATFTEVIFKRDMTASRVTSGNFKWEQE